MRRGSREGIGRKGEEARRARDSSDEFFSCITEYGLQSA
jgi:hypothetical protein